MFNLLKKTFFLENHFSNVFFLSLNYLTLAVTIMHFVCEIKALVQVLSQNIPDSHLSVTLIFLSGLWQKQNF